MDWIWKTHRLWVINTGTEANLYSWETWKQILPSINEIIRLSDADAFIRTFQAYENENKWLGFGRMRWNEVSNIKWTSKYREVESNKKKYFFGTEVWAPDWNQFTKEDTPPDIFIKLYNFPTCELIKEGLVIAISKRIVKRNQLVIDARLNDIKEVIPNSTIAMVARSWWSSRTFPNQIQDINDVEIEKIIKKANSVNTN